MKRKPLRKKSKSAIKKRPTRRSRRLSGLAPIPIDSTASAIPFLRRNLKTPQKRNIKHESTAEWSPLIKEIKNTLHINEVNKDEFDQESVARKHTMKPPLIKAPKYTYNNDEESSENEQHSEEEKSTLLLGDETPEQKHSNTVTQAVNTVVKENISANDELNLWIIVIYCCIFLLHLTAWMKPLNATNLVFVWYNDYIGFALSFVLYSVYRNYLIQNNNQSIEKVYVTTNAINAVLVLTNVLDCFLSIAYGTIERNAYLLHFKSNEWLTFGLLMAHLCSDLLHLKSHYSWLVLGRDAIMIVFFALFWFIGDDAIDLVIVYCFKSLVMIIAFNTDVFRYTMVRDFQLNIISIHFAVWFQIITIFNFSDNNS